MQNKPLISAIVSTYNSEEFIAGKLDDLLSQTVVSQLEIIVVISGSLQKEEIIVKEYQKKNSNIKYISTEKRESIYKAWNRGIKISSGEFITNANTDDRLREDALERMSQILITRNETALIYADQFLTNQPNIKFGDIKKPYHKYLKPDFSRLKLLERCVIGSQPMWRASIHFEDNIWFDEKFEVAGDYEFECRISEKYNIYHLREILGIYYKSDNAENKEYQNREITFNETYQIMEKFGKNYIKRIGVNDKRYLKLYLKLISLIPRFIYYRIIKIIKIIAPYKELYSITFAVWFLSLIEEQYGSKELALQGIKTENNKNHSELINKRYHDLTSVKLESKIA